VIVIADYNIYSPHYAGTNEMEFEKIARLFVGETDRNWDRQGRETNAQQQHKYKRPTPQASKQVYFAEL